MKFLLKIRREIIYANRVTVPRGNSRITEIFLDSVRRSHTICLDMEGFKKKTQHCFMFKTKVINWESMKIISSRNNQLLKC